MGLEKLIVLLFVGYVAAQSYKVCISSSTPTVCQSLDKDGSLAVCQPVESRVDCALKMLRNEVDIGYFSEEEVLLLAQQVPNDVRVIATIRDANRLEPYAFEAVAVVPSTHTNGLEGLRGGRYCHPGFDETDLRWSPRVLRGLEYAAAQTDRVPAKVNTDFTTADQLEVTGLSLFFSSACRPGTWSHNATVDAQLKSEFPSLCSLCGSSGSCNGYNSGSVVGRSDSNRHLQALECLKNNANQNAPAVAYVAWQHVREYFSAYNQVDAPSYSLLCPNGTLVPIEPSLTNTTSPCAFISQPWGAVVTNDAKSAEILSSMRTWFPLGANPGGNTWQSVLFTALTSSSSSARIVFEDAPVTVGNYTAQIRSIPSIDSSPSISSPQRWCTTSNTEQIKCSWIRAAAYTLGVQPAITCLQKTKIFDCLKDISDGIADFIASPSNYGYLARKLFNLAPVKMVQNQRAAATRIAAFLKESSVQSNITRFENLREGKACFPEYGGLAYVSFVRAGHERSILQKDCDYARSVGEFFSGACAPGAIDASHKLSDTDFNTTSLCTACKPLVTAAGQDNSFTCAWDYSNMYFGNNGSLACLADPETSVAFVSTQNIATHLTSLNLQANQFRALCRNNSLAATTGVNIDDGCALAYVVDAEILTRRGSPSFNSINVLLDSLDQYFGYNAATGTQLINIEIFSPFDGNSNLLFKDSTIGLTEPTIDSSHEPAKNYIELFSHLDTCSAGFVHKSIYSMLSVVILTVLSRFVL